MKKKNLAFTLAEVLIVIGIIGVVAALTLPNLNHATGDKERVTKVKKIYAALTEAYDRAQVMYGIYDDNVWFNTTDTTAQRSEKFGKRITEFMKISKECGFETGCFASGHWTDNGTSAYKVITADGMSLYFSYQGEILIQVDIDGPSKGSSTSGKDLFEFYIDREKDFVRAPNSQKWPGSGSPQGLIDCTFGFYSCASGWIIENDNADYLKADSTGKCNDSDIVLDWTTNTSCH